MRFFIIHGTGGSPNGNWFPWLKNELEVLGHEVIVPKFPTPENQSLSSWLGVFPFDLVDSDSIFVAHSLGPSFVLSLLEELEIIPVKACFFVAGFIGKINISEFDELNDSFMNEFDFDKIKSNCKKFYVINSDNDPYVPIEKGEELAKLLNSKLIVIKNGGHLNKEFGYTKFEELLELIKKEI